MNEILTKVLKKSIVMKTLVLLICVLALVYCHSKGGSDAEHNHLHELAQNIMQNLQKEHIPSEGSHSGTPNAPISHLHRTDLISKTTKTKVTVGIKGTQFVSVEANGKVVNITTDFGVGAVAIYNVDKRGESNEIQELNDLIEEENQREVDNTLDVMEEEYLSDSLVAKGNETKVIIAKRAKFNIKIKPMNTKKEIKMRVEQGYIVAAKTNVTKGYTEA